MLCGRHFYWCRASPWLLIYIICDVETIKYTEDFDPSLCSSVHSVVHIELIPVPIPSSALLSPSLAFTLPGCPLPICSIGTCDEGAGRRCSIIQGGLFGVDYFVFRWVWLPKNI